jgi:hypothetical protein
VGSFDDVPALSHFCNLALSCVAWHSLSITKEKGATNRDQEGQPRRLADLPSPTNFVGLSLALNRPVQQASDVD